MHQNANILEQGFYIKIILVALKYLQTTKIGQGETQDYYFIFKCAAAVLQTPVGHILCTVREDRI